MKFLILFLNIVYNFPKIIYFNFHYLPFNQFIKLPIWLFNVKLKKLGGSIIIDNKKIKTGMIRLGPTVNSLYETTRGKFVWEHRGVCCFKGTCIIGHHSAISTGNNAYLEFGDNCSATTFLRITSYKSIIIGDNTRIAWEVIITDTDFHKTINVETKQQNVSSKEIVLGKNNWIGLRTVILKGTITPDFCIAGASSLLNKKYDIPQCSLIAGNPAKLLKTGIYIDLNTIDE